MAAPDVLASFTCSSTSHPAVARFKVSEGGWSLVGASRQRPGSVLPPAPGSELRGSIFIGDGYPGCPSCKADNVVRCGSCQRLSCFDTSWEVFNCPNCGNSGKVSGNITTFRPLGGG